MILLIDNYDSFTYNLVQRIGEFDPDVNLRVVRNDQISLNEIAELQPDRLIISPGPCTPNEAGVSVACVQRFAGQFPILGVCLGHQSIGQAYGARIVTAQRLMHGKTDQVFHHDRGLFEGLPNPLTATRYHSLVIEPASLPNCLIVEAWSKLPEGGREIMAIRHRDLLVFGWQFHPESFLTEVGPTLLQRFVTLPADQPADPLRGASP